MAMLAMLRRLLVLMAVVASSGVLAQTLAPNASVTIAFANELGDGPFRAALLRGLRRQLEASRLQLAAEGSTSGEGPRYAGVLRVRSLAERVNAAGQPTFEATVSMSLVNPETGVGWLARVVRTEYPLIGSASLELLGEASGRRVASAICEVACASREAARARQLREVVPRRIIKESDW